MPVITITIKRLRIFDAATDDDDAAKRNFIFSLIYLDVKTFGTILSSTHPFFISFKLLLINEFEFSI